jgi:spore germination cell wall hydrolase CwlJ-like protein
MIKTILTVLITLSGLANPTLEVEQEQVSKYTMESSLEVILEEEYSYVEDIDSELLEFLGVDQFDTRLLSMVVFGEANLEPQKGQQLVVHTVLNRVEHDKFHNSVESVIYAPSQFCATKLASWGQYTSKNLQNVLLVLYVRKFNLADEDAGFLLYFNGESINDAQYAKIYNLEIITKIGGHTFFARGGERKK